MIPQSNATLTKVTGGAGTEDWDQAPGAGSTAWEGEHAAYFRQKRERRFGQESDLVVLRTLIVETSLRNWTEGEVAFFEFNGEQVSGKVQMVEPFLLPGTGSLSTTRLTFEAA